MGANDESKLPKWVQDELTRLRMRLEEATARLSVGPEDSDTFRDAGWHGDNQPLGMGPTIRFKSAQDRWYFECRRQEDGSLYVNTDSVLLIRPRAANAIIIQANKDG